MYGILEYNSPKEDNVEHLKVFQMFSEYYNVRRLENMFQTKQTYEDTKKTNLKLGSDDCNSLLAMSNYFTA